MKVSIGQSVYVFLAACVISAGAVCVNAQTFSGAGFTIVDGGFQDPNSCSIVTVSGITGNVNLKKVTFTNLAHTFAGDLELSVQSPIVNNDGVGGNMVSFPDSRPCNLNGTYNFQDNASISLAAATDNCTDNQVIAGGNYLPSNYGGNTNDGPLTTLAADFGTLTPAQANGDWQVCAFDYSVGNTGTVGGVSLDFALLPTAAGAQIGGIVVSNTNRRVANAFVTLTDNQGTKTTVKTNAFGNFSFSGVPTGQIYIISVAAKRYRYLPQTVNLTQNLSDLIFAGN